jgi:hypothetical protein
MRGAVIGITSKAQDHPGGDLHMLEYYSRRQRRVARSTFAAETHALADALELGKLISLAITEIIAGPSSARDLALCDETGNWSLPLEASIDAKSVFDALSNPDTRTPTEASILVILMHIKESLMTHSLSRLWWVQTQDMLADGMNKGIIAREAIIAGAAGQWLLRHPAISHQESRRVIIPAASSTQAAYDT